MRPSKGLHDAPQSPFREVGGAFAKVSMPYLPRKEKVSKQLRGANVQSDLYSELTFAYRNRADIEKCAEQAFMAICTYPLSLARWGAAEDRFTVKQWRTVLGLP